MAVLSNVCGHTLYTYSWVFFREDMICLHLQNIKIRSAYINYGVQIARDVFHDVQRFKSTEKCFFRSVARITSYSFTRSYSFSSARLIFFLLLTIDEAPPPVVDCGDPGTPANGRKIGDSYAVGGVVYYECIDGFTLSGDRSRMCRLDGIWTGSLPTCTRNEGISSSTKRQYSNTVVMNYCD